MQKKILMLLNAPYPADIRVKKEADALLAADFRLYLLCRRKANEPAQEVFEGIDVRRIDAGKNNYQVAARDVIMSMTFVHPEFRKAAARLITEEQIGVVHVHDLPLCGTALSLKKSLGIKVVLDMHENYPEALRTWFQWKKNPIVRLKNRLFMNPERWTKLENQAVHGADHVIAVVDEMKGRVAREHGISPSKITVVTNTEDMNFLSQKLDASVYESLKNKFVITYSGGIGPHRGVDTAIAGMEHLQDTPEIQLAIVGFGSPSVMNSLQQLVKTLRLQNVHFLGYQPFSKFYSYMHLADVNVIPHQSNGHTDNTVPHKLFQGMMAAKPLLVSSSAPLRRYVEACGSGVIFNAGDPVDFASKATWLYQHPSEASVMGKKGYQATVDGALKWEVTRSALINLYNSMVQ
jgi:glycosyltransferase involved in cell wall biosynthesis